MARLALHRTRGDVVRTVLVVVLGLTWLVLAAEAAPAQEFAAPPVAPEHAPTGAWGVLVIRAQALIEDLGIRRFVDMGERRGQELRPEVAAVESVHLFLLPTDPLRYLTGPPRWGAIVRLTPEGLPLVSGWSEGMTEYRFGDVTARQRPGLGMAVVGDATVAMASDADGLKSVIDACRSSEATLQAGLSEILGDYSEGTVHGAFLLPEPLGELASESDLEGASRWVHGVLGGGFCLDIGGGLAFRLVLLLGSPEDALQLHGEFTQAIEWLRPDLEAALGGMWGELAWPQLLALESIRTRVEGRHFIAELDMGAEIFAGGDDFVSAADVASYLLRRVLLQPSGAPAAARRPARPGRPKEEPKRRPAAPPEGIWDGFRGIRWGEPLASRDDMVRFAEDETGMMVEYTRKGDSMSAGDAELKRLSYFACEDRFCRVVADIEGADNLPALRLALEAEYGPGRPTSMKSLPDARYWMGFTPKGSPVLGYPLDRCPVSMELVTHERIEWRLTHMPFVSAYERDKRAGRRDPAAERARTERLAREQGERPFRPVPAAPPGWESETRRVTVASPEGDRTEETTYYSNELGMEFVAVPPGEFMMGSSPRQSSHRRYQGPRHRVRITRGFYMGAHEVTQDQYKAVMGSAPSEFPGARRPVEMVTWRDAVAFCRELSSREGAVYRLPTEAEWEYACRAGSTGVYFFAEGLSERLVEVRDEYQRRRGDSPGQTHDVGLMPPNSWGLHGMAWNVREWCQDRYGEHYYWKSPVDDPTGPESGESRVLRGGSSDDVGRWASAEREGYTPAVRRDCVGFRVVCTGEPHPPGDVTSTPVQPPQVTSTTDGQHAEDTGYTNELGMEFVLVPPGQFLMGSPDEEEGRQSNEGPQHVVKISTAFYMGAHEVTQGQHQQIIRKNPSEFLGLGLLPRLVRGGEGLFSN